MKRGFKELHGEMNGSCQKTETALQGQSRFSRKVQQQEYLQAVSETITPVPFIITKTIVRVIIVVHVVVIVVVVVVLVPVVALRVVVVAVVGAVLMVWSWQPEHAWP